MDEQRAVTNTGGPESSASVGLVATRAGDADRERLVALLRDATVEGRLTLDEFSERVERALQARTHEDLLALSADLPVLAAPVAAQKQAVRWVVASSLERRGPWPLPDGYRLNVLCATVVLDLGQAMVEAPITTLQVRNLFSTVTIVVPDGIRVEIDDGGAMLTHHMALSQHAAAPNAPLVRIRTSGVAGSNYIRSSSAGDST